MKAHTAYIAVGSNIGYKIANCVNGINALCTGNATRLVAQSAFYKTEPIGFADQDWFVNGVFQMETDRAPEVLLKRIHSIQAKAGRKKAAVRNGPRILDLDILFYDDWIMEGDQLIIPHPRMHERRFVLQPFCDISPDMIHPVLKTDMKTLLGRLPQQSQQVEKIV